jgi:transcriptional regulator with XRE-family HTH domain
MQLKQAFAKALKQARKAQGLTQEDFSEVSSRTYMSTLERGIKSPTIEKIDLIAGAMQLHPLTIVSLAYLAQNHKITPESLMLQVAEELKQIQKKL